MEKNLMWLVKNNQGSFLTFGDCGWSLIIPKDELTFDSKTMKLAKGNEYKSVLYGESYGAVFPEEYPRKVCAPICYVYVKKQ